MDSILTDSIKTLELDTSLDEHDVITSSVSSGFLNLVSNISDTSKPQLALSIRSHKLWCQARALLAPVLSGYQDVSIQNDSLFFKPSLQPFRFWSSTPLANITLTSANRKADQSHIRICRLVLVLLLMPLLTTLSNLLSHLRVALVDTLSSLPDSEGGIIPVSEVRELLLKVHNILDNAVSKQVGNSTHILAHVFNSFSRQHWESGLHSSLFFTVSGM